MKKLLSALCITAMLALPTQAIADPGHGHRYNKHHYNHYYNNYNKRGYHRYGSHHRRHKRHNNAPLYLGMGLLLGTMLYNKNSNRNVLYSSSNATQCFERQVYMTDNYGNTWTRMETVCNDHKRFNR
jgi:hypothetical protein